MHVERLVYVTLLLIVNRTISRRERKDRSAFTAFYSRTVQELIALTRVGSSLLSNK